MNSIERLVNEHILSMAPYSSARDDFKGSAEVYLDANESFDSFLGVNRYPDPEAKEVRILLEEVLNLPYERTALGNGSDEVIDLLIRIFCKSGVDKILTLDPTYGAYKVFAATSNVEVIKVPLKENLEIDEEEVIKKIKDEKPKLVFLCSPNNPTGNVIDIDIIRNIAKQNNGITVVDEAYADFANNFKSSISLIDENERIVVLRTLSKAWAIAGARVGILIANKYIRDLFFKVKPPYNLSSIAQITAKNALLRSESVKEDIKATIEERERLERFCLSLPYQKEVIKTEANFILLRVEDANKLYSYLMDNSIIVRNRTNERHLKGVLRITIGSKEENEKLMEALRNYEG